MLLDSILKEGKPADKERKETPEVPRKKDWHWIQRTLCDTNH